MNWMLQLYPARWRARYGEEFGAVLASQRASVGLIVDVVGGAIDAHLHPQFYGSASKQIKGGDTMTLEMLQRCALGGPKLSPGERRIAFWLSISSALVISTLYLVLTKMYRGEPMVQAVYWTAVLFPNFIHRQTVYLRKRFWLTQAFVLSAGLSAIYVFMLAVCLLANKL
jgi:hypothetical protein